MGGALSSSIVLELCGPMQEARKVLPAKILPEGAAVRNEVETLTELVARLRRDTLDESDVWVTLRRDDLVRISKSIAALVDLKKILSNTDRSIVWRIASALDLLSRFDRGDA